MAHNASPFTVTDAGEAAERFGTPGDDDENSQADLMLLGELLLELLRNDAVGCRPAAARRGHDQADSASAPQASL